MSDLPGATLVVGVGSGLGAALARRFARAGSPVALGARSPETISALAREIQDAGGRALALPYDVSDPAEVDEAVAEAVGRLGPVRTLLYNVGNAVRGGIEDLAPEDFARAFEVGPQGAFLHARLLFPAMEKAGGGAAIFTGATSSVRSPSRSPAFGAAKFALRGLAMSLNRSWSPRGVHVAHVLVDGMIRTPRAASRLSPDEPALMPDDIAETYYQLAIQPPSSWTFELELRPAGDDYLEN